MDNHGTPSGPLAAHEAQRQIRERTRSSDDVYEIVGNKSLSLAEKAVALLKEAETICVMKMHQEVPIPEGDLFAKAEMNPFSLCLVSFTHVLELGKSDPAHFDPNAQMEYKANKDKTEGDQNKKDDDKVSVLSQAYLLSEAHPEMVPFIEQVRDNFPDHFKEADEAAKRDEWEDEQQRLAQIKEAKELEKAQKRAAKEAKELDKARKKIAKQVKKDAKENRNKVTGQKPSNTVKFKRAASSERKSWDNYKAL